ncbi:PP0621 family protein [Variovorax ureilyticus]|uniref:PP0621 family protein n=1 Tax=Variovorax ureilyticus TaxID=1836198 RepID=UPI003D66BD5E
MKYLLVLAVVFIAIWLWRKGRQEELRSRPPPPPRPAVGAPTEMVRCAHCGLHLPATDAVRGDAGRIYCSAAHRKAAEERG